MVLVIFNFSVTKSVRIDKNSTQMDRSMRLHIPAREVVEHYTFRCRKHIAILADFGAIGDGKTSNTKPFREGIRNLTAKAADGGAQLVVPKGKWLTRSFNLTSNFTLHIQESATILASQVMPTMFRFFCLK